MPECGRYHNDFVTRSEGSVPVCERCEISIEDGMFRRLTRWTFAAACSLCLVVLVCLLGSTGDDLVSPRVTTVPSQVSASSMSELGVFGAYSLRQEIASPITDKNELSAASNESESTTSTDRTNVDLTETTQKSQISAEAQTDLRAVALSEVGSDLGSATEHTTYIIAEGDSLYAIAEKFLPEGAFLYEFTLLVMRTNNIDDSEALRVGMVLKIPLDLSKED